MSAWEKMSNIQQKRWDEVFPLWELLIFEKLQKFGKIEPEMHNTAWVDITMNGVPKRLAKECLDEQIQDMKEQIAEQAEAS